MKKKDRELEPSADAGASTVLTLDESKSPLFKSLRDIDAIEDPDLRLAAALDRLDHISKLALGRHRTTNGGGVIVDPDCHSALKIDEVAHRLLDVNPRKRTAKAPDMSVFSKPSLVKAQ